MEATTNGIEETRSRAPDQEFVDWPLRVSIWLRGDFSSVRLTRTFKRKESTTWESSEYLGAEHVLRAARLLERAHDWLVEHQNQKHSDQRAATNAQ